MASSSSSSSSSSSLSSASAATARREAVEFQIFNVTALLDGLLPVVPRSSGPTVLSETPVANASTGVLVYGRTLEGASVHIQLEMPTNFVVQVPQDWTSRHVQKLANAVGACKFRLEHRTRFVYYTPHLYSNKNRDEPQKLKFARLFFTRHATAQSVYWKYSAEDGFRKGHQRDNAEWTQLLEAADLPAVSDWRDWHLFSAHDLSDPVRDFFAEVDRKLGLSTSNETHASFESWLLLRPEVAWEPAKQFFARSSMNATVKLDDIVRARNVLVAAPMTKISFDIEQYSVLNPLTNTRPFPRFYRTTDEIRNICCAIKNGHGPVRTVALCMGATALPPSSTASEQKEGGVEEKGRGAAPAGTEGEDGAEEKGQVRVVLPGERCVVPGTLTELRVYAREDELLVAFGQLLADEECDLLTGYNIINYDEAAVFSRLYMYHLCKTTSFRELAAIHEVAKEKMDAFAALRAANGKLTQEVRDQIADLFALHASTYELTKDPPLVYVIMSQVLHFDEAAYAYFRDGPPVLSWFYHGKIPTRMISYREHMYDTSAAGQFMMKQWQGTSSAVLCAWAMLKRSQHRLSDYTLRGVLTHFFRGNAEYQKIDLDHETMHDHMESQDPSRLWLVAKYCCRDADAVLFLHDKLCTEVNMRQSGALLRTSIEVQADCGMQRLLLNMMFAELEGSYIINRFQRDVFSYEGAVVIEPITGFYTDPVLTMDYQSLYPSIMIAGNICPTTMLQKRRDKKRPTAAAGVLTRTWVSDPETGQEATFVQNAKGKTGYGVLPKMLRRLLTARRVVQKDMKSAEGEQHMLLNSKQLAIKVCCNSVYGFFGVKEGYFPLTAIAATVTCWGRQLITGETKRRIEEKGFKVIYGDTDSVMVVLTGMSMEEAWATGIELANFISEDVLGEFPSLTILPEKVASLFLLLLKKNYLAIISTNPNKPRDVVLDYKGIEMKRRDKTRLVKEMLGDIVDVMMPLASGADARPETTAPAVSDVVRNWLNKVVCDELGNEYYEASKTAKITYDGARPGHMLVLDRHNARVDAGEQRGVMWDAGKRVPYIVLVGKKQGEVVQWGKGDVSPRMEEPEWVALWNGVPGRKRADKMVVDRVYYLALCETAVVRLLPYHLPSVSEMFAYARTRVVQQLTRSGNMADHLGGARAQMPTGLRAKKTPVKRPAPGKTAAPCGNIGQLFARAIVPTAGRTSSSSSSSSSSALPAAAGKPGTCLRGPGAGAGAGTGAGTGLRGPGAGTGAGTGALVRTGAPPTKMGKTAATKTAATKTTKTAATKTTAAKTTLLTSFFRPK